METCQPHIKGPKGTFAIARKFLPTQSCDAFDVFADPRRSLPEILADLTSSALTDSRKHECLASSLTRRVTWTSKSHYDRTVVSHPTMIDTFIYKVVGSCDIALDVHHGQQGHALPVLLWFHGGELLQGSRKDVPKHIVQGVRDKEYCLVSADYRLAPQVTLKDILSDALDALRFVRRQLSFRMSTGTIYTSDIAVGGTSGGGYLALLLAMRDEKLKCCLTLSPLLDPTAGCLNTLHSVPEYNREELEPYLLRKGKVVSYAEHSPRDAMTRYALETGTYSALLAVDQHQDSPKYNVHESLRSLPDGAKVSPILVVHEVPASIVTAQECDTMVKIMKERGLNGSFLQCADDLDIPSNTTTIHEYLQEHLLGGKKPREQPSLSSLKRASEVACQGHEAGILPTANSAAKSDVPSSGRAKITDRTAEEQWAAQVRDITLLLNLIFLPLAGKYFGRQFAFWTWAKYMNWKSPFQVVRDKGVQRLSSIWIASVS